MTDVSAILSLGTHLKLAADLLKSVLDLGDRAASSSQVASELVESLNTKIRELHAEIVAAYASAFTAQADQFALANRVRELEEQLMQAKDWSAEKERDVMHAVDAGAFAYVLKPGVKPAEPPHWLCQQCFQQQRKSVLQLAGHAAGHHSRWLCGACEQALLVRQGTHPACVTSP